MQRENLEKWEFLLYKGELMRPDVFVFGRGKYCGEKLNALESQYNIVGFLDNSVDDSSNLSEKYKDIPVYLPAIVKDHSNIKVLVMVSFKYLEEICEQLHKLGVNDNNIIIGLSCKPATTPIELLLESRKYEIVVRSGRVYISTQNGDVIGAIEHFKDVLKEYEKDNNPIVKLINQLPVTPSSRYFGSELGDKPIDRSYIEQFLTRNEQCITGTVLEMGNDNYTRAYGHSVRNSIIAHVYGEGKNAVIMNLETGEGVVEDSINCFICTQTLQMIYDLKKAMKNIYLMLTDNGVALITMHANSQLSLYDDNRWGEHWRFTKKSIKKLALEAGFMENDIEIESYGNVKILTAFLYGLNSQQISSEDYDYNDEQYPLIISAKLTKKKGVM